MPRIPRRANDAQVERLLDAMRRDLSYRQQLARRVVASEGLQPGTADYKRRYDSTMRRFQRYVTEASEKRSFARAPVEVQRETRREARQIPYEPKEVRAPVEERGRAPEPPPPARTVERYEDISGGEYEDTRDVGLNDLRAIAAYFDGDIEEAARTMALSARGLRLLELGVTGEGVDVLAMRGGGELADAVRELYGTLPTNDVQDIQDFHDLLMNLPDWQIGMILSDMENGDTTFAEWIDAWHEDNMDLDATSSEYWKLWRAAYQRAKSAK